MSRRRPADRRRVDPDGREPPGQARAHRGQGRRIAREEAAAPAPVGAHSRDRGDEATLRPPRPSTAPPPSTVRSEPCLSPSPDAAGGGVRARRGPARRRHPRGPAAPGAPRAQRRRPPRDARPAACAPPPAVAERGAAEELAALVADLDADSALAPRARVHACTWRWRNVADELRRLQERREADRDGGDPPPMSLPEAARAHRADGAGARPGHPARPDRASDRHVAALGADASTAPSRGASTPSATRGSAPPSAAALEDDIREALSVWYSTNEVRAMRPRVADEVRRLLFFFETVLFDAAADLACQYHRAVDGPDGSATAPPLVFGSWAGGRHGRQPERGPGDDQGHAARAPRARADAAGRPDRAAAPDVLPERRDAAGQRRLSASLERDEQELPETAAYLAGRYPHEAERAAAAQARLHRGPARQHPRPHERRASGRARLRRPRPAGIGPRGRSRRASARSSSRSGRIDRLLWQVRIFGFHLATLEVRENAPELHEACRALLPGYAAADSPEQRVELLTRACLADDAAAARRRPRAAGRGRVRRDRARARRVRAPVGRHVHRSRTPRARPTCCARCGWPGARDCSGPGRRRPSRRRRLAASTSCRCSSGAARSSRPPRRWPGSTATRPTRGSSSCAGGARTSCSATRTPARTSGCSPASG